MKYALLVITGTYTYKFSLQLTIESFNHSLGLLPFSVQYIIAQRVSVLKAERYFALLKIHIGIRLYLQFASIRKSLPRRYQLNNVITHTKKPFHLSSPHRFLLLR